MRTCARCGEIRPATGLTEQSEEIEWKVRLVRRRHVHHRYGPSCDCPRGRGIVIAPKSANRPLAVARKDYYGSGAEWSGQLAEAWFTILATLRQPQICPRRPGSVPALEMESGTAGSVDPPGASAVSSEFRGALLRARVHGGGPGA